MRDKARQALNNFDDALTDIIIEHLLGTVTPEEVNENYGYFSKHPVAQILIELEKERNEGEKTNSEPKTIQHQTKRSTRNKRGLHKRSHS